MPINDMKASAFFAMRTSLLTALAEIDAEIDKALGFKTSKRAADKARQLFAQRSQVADELVEFGVEVDAHPALQKRDSGGNGHKAP